MKHFIYVLAAIVMVVSGCTDAELKKSIVEDMVNKRINDHKRTKIIDCRKEAFVIADLKVDSLLKARARDQKIDDFLKPEKPIRPQLPSLKDAKSEKRKGPIILNDHLYRDSTLSNN